jgi:hypothetical protein
LASFRQRFGKQFESAFVQMLQVARENQLSRFGAVSLDGTKIHANASRHSYEAKVAAREAQAAATGKKPKGRAPKPPESGPRSDDQLNLTDEESRIMPDAGGGFEQSYNAQAIVDNASMLVLVAHVSQATNDKQQLQPMLEKLQALPTGLNSPETLAARIAAITARRMSAPARAPRLSR